MKKWVGSKWSHGPDDFRLKNGMGAFQASYNRFDCDFTELLSDGLLCIITHLAPVSKYKHHAWSLVSYCRNNGVNSCCRYKNRKTITISLSQWLWHSPLKLKPWPYWRVRWYGLRLAFHTTNAKGRILTNVYYTMLYYKYYKLEFGYVKTSCCY